MERPAAEKKILRLVIFVLLVYLFSTSTLWSALHPWPDKEGVHHMHLYSHSHHSPDAQPPDNALDLGPKESLRLKVTGARLECTEDECTHHQDHCALEIHYHLSAEFRSNLDVDAQVVCHACLDYTTGLGYHLKSDNCSSPSHHHLTRSSQLDGKIVVDFQFSPYEQVVDAEVKSIRCRIEQVDTHHSRSPRYTTGPVWINE